MEIVVTGFTLIICLMKSRLRALQASKSTKGVSSDIEWVLCRAKNVGPDPVKKIPHLGCWVNSIVSVVNKPFHRRMLTYLLKDAYLPFEGCFPTF